MCCQASAGNLCDDSEIPEWLQEFRENLVDERVLEHSDSHISSSHEISSEATSKRSEDLGKHSVHTHFPKDRNCEICQRTKSPTFLVQEAVISTQHPASTRSESRSDR